MAKYQNSEIAELSIGKNSRLLEGQEGSEVTGLMAFELFNSLLGTGLASIPIAFSVLGIGNGAALLLITSFIAWCTLHLLMMSAELASSKSSDDNTNLHNQVSYSSIAHSSLGFYAAVWADLIMAVSCFGFATSYLVSIGDVLPALVKIPLGFTFPRLISHLSSEELKLVQCNNVGRHGFGILLYHTPPYEV